MRVRKVLVTGASRGIGKASSDLLLEKGHEVYGIARNLQKHHPNFHPFEIDLSDVEDLPSKLDPFKDLDTLVCNVGKGHFGNLEELSFSQIRSLLELNFLSHVYLVKELLPSLKKKKRADIIFIGSEASLNGKRKGSIYCASKFALRGFAQALRDECAASSVKVSMIQPGMVRTPFYDPLSFGPGSDPSHAILPEDVAEMILAILSMRAETILDEIILSPKKHVVQKKSPQPHKMSCRLDDIIKL